MRFSPPLSSQLSQFAIPLGQALLRQRELALQCLLLKKLCLRLIEISTEGRLLRLQSARQRIEGACDLGQRATRCRDQRKLAAGITQPRQQIGRKTQRTADGLLSRAQLASLRSAAC